MATNTLLALPRLREVRTRAVLTQGQLAEKAKVAVRTVVAIEMGAPAKVRTVQALAKALGVKPAELMADEPTMAADEKKAAQTNMGEALLTAFERGD